MPGKTHYFWEKPGIKEEPYAIANDSTQEAKQPVKGMHLQRNKNEISKAKAPEKPATKPKAAKAVKKKAEPKSKPAKEVKKRGNTKK